MYELGTCIAARDEEDVPDTCPVHGESWPCGGALYLNLARIAARVRDAGYPETTICETGGGVLTLFAGVRSEDTGRYTCLVGPGGMPWSGGNDPVIHVEEGSYGPDDDGVTPAFDFPATATEETVAALVIAFIRERLAAEDAR